MDSEVEVLIAGGGPVGLAAGIELGRRGIRTVIVEPRATVSHARPRCKTVNIRTMEHLRRWGIAERFRALAPLPVSFSQDIVFCTSLAGHELSRFHGVLGLAPEPDRSAELGQQSPQYVLEELLRDVVVETPAATLLTGWRVAGLEQDDDRVETRITDESGEHRTITSRYVIGADGGRSAVRDAIGARYVGEQALAPNFGMVFRAPGLLERAAHGPAIQYWLLNRDSPALMGPIDRDGTWWLIALGVDAATGAAHAADFIRAAAGMDVDPEVISHDPWTARMQLVDRLRVGRVFLAGDAAHLNPPFGGHGLNTGVGDAVDLGWKLSAVIRGWGGPRLLDSYEAERRPIQTRVIAAAVANNRVLVTDLLSDGIDEDGPGGDAARRTADEQIQAAKRAEFHALSLVLDLAYEGSPVIAADGPAQPIADDDEPVFEARPGARLPHAWIAEGRSVHDELGDGLTLLTFDSDLDPSGMTRAAADTGVPFTTVLLDQPPLHDRYGAAAVLVRPDQHVAWRGDALPGDPAALLDLVRGEQSRHPMPKGEP